MGQGSSIHCWTVSVRKHWVSSSGLGALATLLPTVSFTSRGRSCIAMIKGVKSSCCGVSSVASFLLPRLRNWNRIERYLINIIEKAISLVIRLRNYRVTTSFANIFVTVFCGDVNWLKVEAVSDSESLRGLNGKSTLSLCFQTGPYLCFRLFLNFKLRWLNSFKYPRNFTDGSMRRSFTDVHRFAEVVSLVVIVVIVYRWRSIDEEFSSTYVVLRPSNRLFHRNVFVLDHRWQLLLHLKWAHKFILSCL